VRSLLLFLLLLPLGCGRADATRADLHVLARVNGAEISSADAPGEQALEREIERELLVQQALEASLERDPEVHAALERARREVLAQAWLERRAAPERASREDVRAFYAANPALFAQRRIYRLRTLEATVPAPLMQALREQASRAAALYEVAAWLHERNVPFVEAALTRPAEQLPLAHLEELARLANLKALARLEPGALAVLASPDGGAAVVELVEAEPSPLDEAQAAPLIEQFLAGRRRLERAAAEVKRLREAASIEYVGDIQARAR
jgi:EpsD family peptidyl-prolyl cis-trans isomerase